MYEDVKKIYRVILRFGVSFGRQDKAVVFFKNMNNDVFTINIRQYYSSDFCEFLDKYII